MVKGLSLLAELRKEKIVPRSVWLSIGVPYRKPLYLSDYDPLELVAYGSVSTDDFRPLVGLSVTFYAVSWDELAAECFEKLKKYAKEVIALIVSYGDDIGFIWSQKYGMTDLGEIGWLEQYDEARTRVCRTPQEVLERVRLENEAKEKLSRNPEEYRNG